MYYISLDEVGDFENIKGERDTKPVFIGGVIYEADSQAEFDKEKERIKRYLSAVCESVGKSYPHSLHVDEKTGSSAEDVKAVKTAVSNSISAFLKDMEYPGKGSMPDNLKRRDGRYYLYVYLKGERGKRNQGDRIFSNMSNDDFAGNLYLHMAEDVVARLLFQNPVIDDGSNTYFVDLATRKFVYRMSDRGHSFEDAMKISGMFDKLGFKRFYGTVVEQKLKNREAIVAEDYGSMGSISYELTNRNNYWLSIERESFHSPKPVKIDSFQVRSIYYGESVALKMGFLYLADLICSMLSFQLKTGPDMISQIDGRLSDLAGSDYQLFIYDDADTVYSDALVQFEQNNYYEMFEKLYEITVLNGMAAKYYAKHLIQPLTEACKKSLDIEKLYSAIARLTEFSYSNQGKRDKLLYLFEGIENLHGSVDLTRDIDTEKWGRYTFDLYDVGGSAYTHNGDVKSAIKYLDKCAEYYSYVPVEKWIVNTNKLAVLRQDEFEYDLAYNLAEENAAEAKKIYDSLENVGCTVDSITRAYSKAMSQYGQIASVKSPDKAKAAFLEALDATKEDEKNYLITYSYYLHYLIEQNMREDYERCAEEYFGCADHKGQLAAIKHEADKESGVYRRFSPEFALFVYVKALYVFGGEADADLKKALSNIDKYFKNSNLGQKGHPWELIYKYLAFIQLKNNDKERAKKYIERIDHVNPGDDQIIKAIACNAKRLYYEKTGDTIMGDSCISEEIQILEYINKNKFSGLKNLDQSEQQKILEEVFCYMYD